ncbi:MAG TPA: trigger factor [Terriglobales bacterium]|nr:trigger factor [Terriglobales bacterium]
MSTESSTNHDPCTREVSVEVPADVVARETESVVQNYQKLARLPGFRKGKVPITVVRSRFAGDIRGEVIERLVPRYFREEVEKQKLEPVSQPQVTDLHIKEGEPMRFKATFEVLPPIEVTGYQELRAEKTDTNISEEEVTAELNNLRERRAVFTPVEDRALADGDFADVSFTSTPKEEGGKPVPVNDVLVHIGGPDTVKEFSENLRGARAGEERTFDVAYPEDFNDPRLAGKTVEYKVEVKAIKQKSLPELNDDFAKSLGDFEDLETVKQRIREGLESEKKHRAEHEAKEKLMDELVRRNEFPVPESMVEHQIDLRLERGLRALAAQGLSAEHMKKMDLPRLRAGQRDAAVKEVKASLILEKIAEAEKIEVSDEEVGKEIDALARQTKQSSEEIRSRLTRDGALDKIRNRIRNEKALDFLYRRSA